MALELTDEQKAIARGHDPEDAARAVAASDSPPAAEHDSAAVSEQPGSEASSSTDGSSTEAARSAAPSGQAEPTASEPKTEPTKTEWLTDEHRELAASYGFAPDDIKDFGSAEEFRKATRLIDRQLQASVEAQRQAAQQHYAQQQAQQQAQAAAEKTQSTASKLTKLDLEKLKAAGYDEDTLNLLKTQNDVIDAFEASQKEMSELREQNKLQGEQFGQFQNLMAQSEAQRRINYFHEAVDGLNDDRFGKTIGTDGKFKQLSKTEDELRRKLYETHDVLVQGMIAQQRAAGFQPQLPPLSVILQRAKQLAFAEDIRAEEKRKVHEELKAQAKRVRPVATQRANNGQYLRTKNEPQTVNDRIQELQNNPAIAAAWAKALESSGVGGEPVNN